MKSQTSGINFFIVSFLIALFSHIDSRAIAGQINAGVFGAVEDFVTVFSKDWEELASITLSTGNACINVQAQGSRFGISGCLSHSFLDSLIINLQSVWVAFPIDLSQFPGAVCALFALSLSRQNPVIPNQHTSVINAHASANGGFLVLTLGGVGQDNPADHTELTLIPGISTKGSSVVKVIIRIGCAMPLEFIVRFGSNKQGQTSFKKKGSSSDDRDAPGPDGSGKSAFARLWRSSSLKRSSSSSGTKYYCYGAQGSNYIAASIPIYLSRFLLPARTPSVAIP